MQDTNHLVWLHESLHREKARIALAKSETERRVRTVWAEQKQREIEAEMRFLGISSEPINLSDDELLRELTA